MTPALRASIVPLLTLVEAAGRLGLSSATVSRMIERGIFTKLRVSPLGWRVSPVEVDAYAASHVVPVAPSDDERASAPAQRGSHTGETRHTANPPRSGAVRLAGVTPLAAWPRFGRSVGAPPAVFLAFPDREGVLRYATLAASL